MTHNKIKIPTLKTPLYFKIFANRDKFNVDLFWSIICFGISGVIGILINIIIIKYYGTESLGVFNLVYAIYLLLSQVATLGIHMSVQRYVPQFFDDKKVRDIVVTSAIVTTLIISSTITLICYFFRQIPGELFNNKDISTGFLLVLPGLIFFSLNKVELSFLNGYRLIRSFAVFQALRYFLMLLILFALIFFGFNRNTIPLTLTGTEIILFISISIYSAKYWKLSVASGFINWSRTHIVFGSRVSIGNMLFDLNTRVDVLVLGFFTDEKIVGIYSFAASMADGFNQLTVVLRNNINPILTKCYFKKGINVLERLIKKIKNNFYKIIFVLGFAAVFIFPLVIKILGLDEELSGSWLVFSTKRPRSCWRVRRDGST
ncbi:MAG: oligosaccharide flippase family protein [bacterium]